MKRARHIPLAVQSLPPNGSAQLASCSPTPSLEFTLTLKIRLENGSVRIEPVVAPEPGTTAAPIQIAVASASQQSELPIPASPLRTPNSALSTLRTPHSAFPYALHREGSLWHLRLNGHPAILKHEQALFYVAHLFAHPADPTKKLDLASNYATLRQASLAPDNDEARRRHLQKARELKETLDDPSASESDLSAAREELEQIADHLSRDQRPARDEAKKAADAIRATMNHLLRTLAKSNDPVHRDFATHLLQHVILPSHRFSDPKARHARGELAGCLLYEPPPGVQWSVEA
jgi:hypothetical protein